MKYCYGLLIGACLLISGCSTSDPEPVEGQVFPSSVTLIFPFEDSECNDGVNITDTESTVIFEWFASEFTDVYEIHVINLNNEERIVTTTTVTKFPVTLQRATPYAWYVISKSNLTDSIAQSDTWKFYNSGEGIESYAPFPAEIVAPSMAQVIDAPSEDVNLSWEGTDIDNDIIGYDLYFGAEPDPQLYEEGLNSTTLNVPVVSETIYYWRVITHDAAGHSSKTAVYQFRIE